MNILNKLLKLKKRNTGSAVRAVTVGDGPVGNGSTRNVNSPVPQQSPVTGAGEQGGQPDPLPGAPGRPARPPRLVPAEQGGGGGRVGVG